MYWQENLVDNREAGWHQLGQRPPQLAISQKNLQERGRPIMRVLAEEQSGPGPDHAVYFGTLLIGSRRAWVQLRSHIGDYAYSCLALLKAFD